MVSEDFKVGDLVWAKMKNFPPWPGIIEEPSQSPSKMKMPKNKKAHLVKFFGTENYAWIPDENINHHSESVLKNCSKKKTKAYQTAIDALLSRYNTTKKESPVKTKKKIKDVDEEKVANNANSVVKKDVKEDFSKKPKKRSHFDLHTESIKYSPSKSRKLAKMDYISRSLFKTSPLMNIEKKYKKMYARQNHKNHNKNLEMHIPNKRYGFIGLGNMGKAIVKNMIMAGHDVTVYNRNVCKCIPLVKLGAKQAQSPAELIVQCDVTFCCVSDSDASKELIFNDRGVLIGLDEAEKLGMGRKGYVEMTSMDPETSLYINEAIGMKRGLYLEAPLWGSSEDAENGTLLIIASGDRRVFTDCESCFHAIGRHAFYLTCEIGYSTKLSLLLGMFSATALAAVAEVLVLAERLNVPKELFLKLVCDGPLSCREILQKLELMRKHHDLASFANVEQIQRDLTHALVLANNFSQPMPVTAAANESFKVAKINSRKGIM